MKTPTATQLPSGAWRVRIMVDGHTVSITRPTKKEAEREALALKSGAVKVASGTKHLTLTEAIDAYIDSIKIELSPSTLKAYHSYQKNRMQSAMCRDISTISDKQWQKFIDEESKEVSAKTVHNMWELVGPAVKYVTGHKPEVNLPKKAKHKNEIKYLTDNQIKLFLDGLKGDDAEIPVLFMLCSLRSSEVADIQWKDIDFKANTAHVNGSAVFGDDGLVHRELNKTDRSNRKVPMIEPLVEALKKAAKQPHKPDDYICTIPGITVYKHINSICKKIGLPAVGRHGMRKSFASLALVSLGIEEEMVMELGGWSDRNTMHEHYIRFNNDAIAERAKRFTDFYTDKKDQA